MKSMLLWVDLEATGSKDDDPIIEVGALVTDQVAPWDEIESYSSVCKPEDPEWDQGIKDVVVEMHTVNGLFDDVRASSCTLGEIEDDLIEILARNGKRHEFTLAGSGVGHYDRRLIRTQMPRLEKWLRYPNFDIGDVRRLMSFAGRGDLIRAGVSQGQPGEVNKAHRGLADIRDHVAEARKYAEMVQGMPADWQPMIRGL